MTTPSEPLAQPPDNPAIPFKEFLETIPPGSRRTISDLQASRPPNSIILLNGPVLTLHCERCGGPMKFQLRSDQPQLKPGRTDLFMRYQCRNCTAFEKVFAVWMAVTESLAKQGEAYKYGENPQFGAPTPNRLLALLGDDKGTFLKGRISENQGLGIGAFGYYRRVVENQKNQILDEIIKVAERTNAKPDSIVALKSAKEERQFSAAMDRVKDAIPTSLLIKGHHNPLTLLHNALSKHLHERSEAECLALATDIRVVMQELAERLAVTLKDDAQLAAAVSRLQNERSGP